MLAGTSEVRITPPVGTPLLGPTRPATGVHDDLFARVLVLSDGTRAAAIVCLDLVGLDLGTAAATGAAARRQTGIADVLLACSHTHSAPFTIPWSVLGWEWMAGAGRAWAQDLVVRVAGAVGDAARALRPAVLRAGRAPVQVGMNRRLPGEQGVTMRPNPDGAVVPWTDVLRVDSLDGRPVAVLFSHAAHPVFVHAASTLISADYPGSAAAAVRARFDGAAVAVFAQGCGGNVNGEPLRGGFEAARRAGEALGQAAAEAARQAEPLDADILMVRSVTIDLPLQALPSPEACARSVHDAEDHLREAQRRDPGNEEGLWGLKDRLLCLQDLAARVERGEPATLPFTATALSVGDRWCLLALTHEVFAEYQLWADAVSPFAHTMVLAYTNGCEAYIPTDQDLAMGGYEAAVSPEPGGAALRYPRRLALRAGTEERVRQVIALALTSPR